MYIRHARHDRKNTAHTVTKGMVQGTGKFGVVCCAVPQAGKVRAPVSQTAHKRPGMAVETAEFHGRGGPVLDVAVIAPGEDRACAVTLLAGDKGHAVAPQESIDFVFQVPGARVNAQLHA